MNPTVPQQVPTAPTVPNIPLPPIPPAPTKTTPFKIVITVLVLIIIVLTGVLGYSYYRFSKLPTAQNITPDPLLVNQGAVVVGTITQISGSKVTITDGKGHSENFTINNQLNILKPGATVPTHTVNDIVIGTQAAIGLTLTGNHFEVNSINYNIGTLNTSGLRTNASSSATTK